MLQGTVADLGESVCAAERSVATARERPLVDSVVKEHPAMWAWTREWTWQHVHGRVLSVAATKLLTIEPSAQADSHDYTVRQLNQQLAEMGFSAQMQDRNSRSTLCPKLVNGCSFCAKRQKENVVEAQFHDWCCIAVVMVGSSGGHGALSQL
jgi:hypothetical protein